MKCNLPLDLLHRDGSYLTEQGPAAQHGSPKYAAGNQGDDPGGRGQSTGPVGPR